VPILIGLEPWCPRKVLLILADLPMLCLNELHEADRIATHANRIIKDKAMEVGFIGLGKMGTGMATSLLRAGYTLTVYNRTPGRDEELVRDGAKRANEIVDARRSDAVITAS
jgi:glutamyl-tRNA reductase